MLIGPTAQTNAPLVCAKKQKQTKTSLESQMAAFPKWIAERVTYWQNWTTERDRSRCVHSFLEYGRYKGITLYHLADTLGFTRRKPWPQTLVRCVCSRHPRREDCGGRWVEELAILFWILWVESSSNGIIRRAYRRVLITLIPGLKISRIRLQMWSKSFTLSLSHCPTPAPPPRPSSSSKMQQLQGTRVGVLEGKRKDEREL